MMVVVGHVCFQMQEKEGLIQQLNVHLAQSQADKQVCYTPTF